MQGRNRIKQNLISTVFFSLAIGVAAQLNAAAPGEINYQGKLTDSSGNPASGNFDMVFRIYDAATGGTPLVTDVRQGTDRISVSNGVFNAVIGGIPATLTFASPITELRQALQGGADRWLAVTVNGTDLSPRQKLVAAPYALAVAAGSVGNIELANNAVTGAKILDGTITDVDISDISPSKILSGTANINISGRAAVATTADSANTAGSAGTAGTATNLSGAGTINITGGGDHRIDNGNVIIGTGNNLTNTAKLNVAGNIRMTRLGTLAGSPPASANLGFIDRGSCPNVGEISMIEYAGPAASPTNEVFMCFCGRRGNVNKLYCW